MLVVVQEEALQTASPGHVIFYHNIRLTPGKDHAFASNQTGNSVLLAVGVAGILDSSIFSLPNIGVSLSAFVLGGFVLGQLGNYFGPRRRWWLVLTNALQTAMVFAAVGMQYRFGINIPGERRLGIDLAVIALLAFSSGGQVAMARALQMTEITTAMATAAYGM